MELDQLRNFLAVARTGSFTAASEEIGLSQPAISRSVARLEEEIGQPLFERGPRKISLTDAGELLKNRAQQAVSILEDTKTEICDDGKSGRIRVGAIPTIAPFVLPHLLRTFSDQFPDANVLVQEDTTENLCRRLHQGEIDIAIMVSPITEKHLDVEKLFEEELLVVMPVDHPLASKKQIQVEDLESLPFVLLGEAHCLTDNVVSFCRGRSIQPVAIERTNQLVTVQELVSLDHGISMVPEMARRLDTSDQRLYRSLSGTKPTRTIVSCWNPYRFQSKLLDAFKEVLRRFDPQQAR